MPSGSDRTQTDKVVFHKPGADGGQSAVPSEDDIKAMVEDGLFLPGSWIEPDSVRDERFRELNDRIWGEGNWLRCPSCPHDDNDREIYHHKDAHG